MKHRVCFHELILGSYALSHLHRSYGSVQQHFRTHTMLRIPSSTYHIHPPQYSHATTIIHACPLPEIAHIHSMTDLDIVLLQEIRVEVLERIFLRRPRSRTRSPLEHQFLLLHGPFYSEPMSSHSRSFRMTCLPISVLRLWCSRPQRLVSQAS